MKVWNFEFRSLLFVCYLDFVICNFHVSIRIPKSEIYNLKSLHAYFCEGVQDSIDFRKNLFVGKVPNLGSPTGAVG